MSTFGIRGTKLDFLVFLLKTGIFISKAAGGDSYWTTQVSMPYPPPPTAPSHACRRPLPSIGLCEAAHGHPQ